MKIQASRHFALRSAAALIVALAWGLAGSGPSYATAGSAANGTLLLAADSPADSNAAAPLASDTNAEADADPTDRSIGPGRTIHDIRVATTAVPEVTAASPAIVTSSDDGGWEKASLIGKILIACGTLLTLGSAARMFMV